MGRPPIRRFRMIRAFGRWSRIGLLVITILLLVDGLVTWQRHRARIAALTTEAPDLTAYMARRREEGTAPIARRWMPLDSLPTPVVCAVVGFENVNFFQHGAMDWNNQRDLLRRVLHADFSRGGSGITQQLARNLFLSPARTPLRKWREYILSFEIAQSLSKERQLELYLNLVEWAPGVWGAAAGSQALFGRPVAELTPTEVVLLASVLPAPSRGLPFTLIPARRARLERVSTSLWRQVVFDDVTWSATQARLRRVGELVDTGLDPRGALLAAAREMGPERPADRSPLLPTSNWATRCDQSRRGVT